MLYVTGGKFVWCAGAGRPREPECVWDTYRVGVATVSGRPPISHCPQHCQHPQRSRRPCPSVHCWSVHTFIFTPFQCWLQLVVFHLKEDFLSNFVLILTILNLSLWVLYYTVKLWNACFWTTLGCSFTCYRLTFYSPQSSLWICHLKMIKLYRELDRKSSFTSAAIWWSSYFCRTSNNSLHQIFSFFSRKNKFEKIICRRFSSFQ